jgi:hypothetical protein
MDVTPCDYRFDGSRWMNPRLPAGHYWVVKGEFTVQS